MNSQDILPVAEAAARRVGARIRSEIYDPTNYKVMYKGDVNLVTEIDIWSENELTKAIHTVFPDHGVVGEEGIEQLLVERKTSFPELVKQGVWWVIDPIDGTTNFANGIPQVGISLAVLHDGKRLAGVIYDPIRDEMFSAFRGEGTTLNGKPISVSSKEKLRKSVVATGVPYDRGEEWQRYRPTFEAFLMRSRDLRRFGAATLDQCWVACGRFDAFFEYGLKPWDVAAGSVIVEEAGGRTGHFDSTGEEEFSIFKDSFLFSSPVLFPEMLEVVAEVSNS